MQECAIIYDAKCLEHDTGFGHPESPRRLPAILEAFKQAELTSPWLDVSPATRADLLRNHTQDHLDGVRSACSSGESYSDPDTVMGPGSWEAALLAAGGAISAARAVQEKQFPAVFSVMRPPGHHAEAHGAMGFCLFNNVAIAARWLQSEAGVKKIAIIDWDVHHGNGTQHSFYTDDTVFYASIHQHPLYPGTGFAHERGKNKTNLNIPMAPGAEASQWLEAMQEKVLPAIEAFEPDFVFISAGFDAHRQDPLAHQRLVESDFSELTRMAMKLSGNRLVSLLEGGYHLDALGQSALAHVKTINACLKELEAEQNSAG